MLDKLSDASRRLLIESRHQASRLGQSQVGTEHLLLASLSDTSFVSARALGAVLGDTTSFKRALEAVLRPGFGAGSVPAPMSDEARTSVETALVIANEMGSPLVGTGHILLGLLEDTAASWVPLAAALGVSRAELQTEVEILTGSSDGDPTFRSSAIPSAPVETVTARTLDSGDDLDLIIELREQIAELRKRIDLLETQFAR